MGMAAGQARLLSITARLTDNELRSQTITNSKLRLADQSSEASAEYMDALNTQQLMYSYYDSSGAKTSMSLTPNVLMTYSDLKNQYAMVNSAGQIMVSSSDIENFESSDTLADFLYSYGIEKTENPEYIDAMTNIYGDDYEKYMNISTESLSEAVNAINDKEFYGIQYSDYATLMANYNGVVASLDKVYNDSWYGRLCELLNSDMNPQPDASQINAYHTDPGNVEQFVDRYCDEDSSYGFSDVENEVSSSGFPAKYNISTDGLEFMEQHLSSLIWNDYGLYTENPEDGSASITSSTGITITKNEVSSKDVSLTNQTINVDQYVDLFDRKSDEEDLSTILNLEYTSAQEMKQSIIDLYCDIVLLLQQRSENSDTGVNDCKLDTDKFDIEINPEESSETEEVSDINVNILVKDWRSLFYNLQNNFSDNVTNEYTAAETKYQAFVDSYKNWITEIKTALDDYTEKLEDVQELAPEIPDTDDSRYQWYVNLWYRMGGTSETTKSPNAATNYKELDENLMNNSEWLQFALEQGVITLEQATFSEDGSDDYPGMGTYDWKSITYSNASDITSQDNEAAIAKAEIKYKNALTEIENQDKKYDQDLKKLDTEHTALQTEYESVKSVIDKNVERSFKAFS